ncbi:hypothetical protein ACI2OX_04090 [Bacillus sp. N9]
MLTADRLKDAPGTYVLPLVADVVWNGNDRIFIPPHLFKETDERMYVYFDLEQYPFFKK